MARACVLLALMVRGGMGPPWLSSIASVPLGRRDRDLRKTNLEGCGELEGTHLTLQEGQEREESFVRRASEVLAACSDTAN